MKKHRRRPKKPTATAAAPGEDAEVAATTQQLGALPLFIWQAQGLQIKRIRVRDTRAYLANISRVFEVVDDPGSSSDFSDGEVSPEIGIWTLGGSVWSEKTDGGLAF
eukprot:COSAG06_NODE_17344_length_946_cov_9.111962_2_plen_107_part_00